MWIWWCSRGIPILLHFFSHFRAFVSMWDFFAIRHFAHFSHPPNRIVEKPDRPSSIESHSEKRRKCLTVFPSSPSAIYLSLPLLFLNRKNSYKNKHPTWKISKYICCATLRVSAIYWMSLCQLLNRRRQHRPSHFISSRRTHTLAVKTNG